MIVVTCTCGSAYKVKAELAGRVVKCGHCGTRLKVPRDTKQEPVVLPTETAMGATSRAPDSASVGQQHGQALPSQTVASGARVSHAPPASPRSPARGYGPYTIVRPIGHGGMGQVSVARDEPLEREVALKELLAATADDPRRRRRFVEEAEITGQLQHPGVVPVYALGMDDQNRPFYAMRYVCGGTLEQAIDEYLAAPATPTLRGLLQHLAMVCQTMAYAHARGIIHRDLKPANVIVGEFGETLILDWGLARPVDGSGSSDAIVGDLAAERLADRGEVTAPGGVIGTPHYMSPEQAMGSGPQLGPAADIYSLGAMLYKMLTGRPAYQGTSSSSVLDQVKAGPPPQPSTIRPDVPRPLEAICLKAMARQPRDRYPTAAALGQDLEHWLDDDPVDAWPESIRERAVRWVRRHKALAVALFLAAVSAVIGSSTTAVMVAREQARTARAATLAQQYDRQAADALERAREKVKEAGQLAREAAEARAQAALAAQEAARATEAVDQAKARIAQLESDLKTKTQDHQELAKQLEQSLAELTTLEARAAAEIQRAREADERARALERQVSDRRKEAQALRRLAAQLTEWTLHLRGQPTPTPPAMMPGTDLTEEDPATFDLAAVDGSACQLDSESSRVMVGRRALRVENGTAHEVCLTYPLRRNARWDLSSWQYLYLAVFVEDADQVFQAGSPRIRLGCGSRYVEYEAPAGALAVARGTWARFTIPLSGDVAWTRTDVHGLDFSHVDWLEIHVATEKTGLRIWLDDLQFGPRPNEPPVAVAPFNADRARRHQEAWAKYLNVPVETTNSIGMKFILIPPGEFDMGSTEEEVAKLLEEAKAQNLPEWYTVSLPQEAPRHRIRITRPFWLGVHEVTRGQFRQFVEDRSYKTDAERDGKGGWGMVDGQGKQDPRFVWNGDLGFDQADDHPVVNVSWNDATAFCAWLSEKEGEQSHLPSEAQWEYACRAGTATTWYSGDDEESLKEYGWFCLNAGSKTHPVGQKWPNAWGLYDMHGNVWESCRDWLGDRYYASSPMNDPLGAPEDSYRVFRGGGWWDPVAGGCRAARRSRDLPSVAAIHLGFRLARSVPSSSTSQ